MSVGKNTTLVMTVTLVIAVAFMALVLVTRQAGYFKLAETALTFAIIYLLAAILSSVNNIGQLLIKTKKR